MLILQALLGGNDGGLGRHQNRRATKHLPVAVFVTRRATLSLLGFGVLRKHAFSTAVSMLPGMAGRVLPQGEEL
jgi:hypothetical protein